MQTLWSRARSATNSCRCSLCNPPRATVPRRTTGAPATRRKHGVNDAITIFYGTMIAAALFTDASSKIGARGQLERDLERAKQENERLEEGNRERLKRLGLKWKEGELVEAVEETDGRPWEGLTRGERILKMKREQERGERHARFAHRNENVRKNEAKGLIRWIVPSETSESNESLPSEDNQENYRRKHKALMRLKAGQFMSSVVLQSRHTQMSSEALIATINERDHASVSETRKQGLDQLDRQMTELMADTEALGHEAAASLRRSLSYQADAEDHGSSTSSPSLAEQIQRLQMLAERCADQLADTTNLELRRKRRAELNHQTSRIDELLHGSQSTDDLDERSAKKSRSAEENIRSQMAVVRRLGKEIAKMKGINRKSVTDSDRSTLERRIQSKLTLLTKKRLKLQNDIDKFTAYTSPDLEEATLDGPEVYSQAWPVGRTPEEIWNIQFMDKGSHYWRKRRSHVVSAMICRLVQKGMEANEDFMVHLDERLEESHPLHPSNINIHNVREEADKQHDLMRQMVDYVEDRRSAISCVEAPTFPNYKRHNRDSVDIELGRDRHQSNVLCDLMANSQNSWHTLARICEVLAGAKSPPSIQTFNILLTNLPRIGLQECVPIIYIGLIACGLTPNEVTSATFLQSLADLKRHRWLCLFAEQIDVAKGQGVVNLSPASYDLLTEDLRVLTDHFWERRTREDDLYSMRLAPHPYDKNQKRWLRQPINQQMYEALICGFYGAGQRKKAQRMILRMEASGFKLNAKILNAMLRTHLYYPRPHHVIQTLHEYLKGHYPGSKAELAESVYLFFHVLSRTWRGYLMRKPRSAEASAKYAEFRSFFDQLNKHALRNQFIDEPLNHKYFIAIAGRMDKNDGNVLVQQLELMRRLSTPVLHLKFEAASVQSLTEPCTDRLWVDVQPRSLQDFVHERLAILHQDYVNRHGTLPGSELSKGLMMGGTVALTRERHVSFLHKRRIARRRLAMNMATSTKSTAPTTSRVYIARTRRTSRARRGVSQNIAIRVHRARRRQSKALAAGIPLPARSAENPLEETTDEQVEQKSKPPHSPPTPQQSHDEYEYFRGRKVVADFPLGSSRVVARTSIEFR